MGDTLMAVEFRNASWWNERNRASTLAFEREHGLVNVVVDGPRGVGNSVPAVWEVTSPQPGGRPHARPQPRDMEPQGPEGRVGPVQLRLLAKRSSARSRSKVAELSKAVPVVHAVMNNNYEDQGQRNAKTLSTLLKAHSKSVANASTGDTSSS